MRAAAFPGIAALPLGTLSGQILSRQWFSNGRLRRLVDANWLLPAPSRPRTGGTHGRFSAAMMSAMSPVYDRTISVRRAVVWVTRAAISGMVAVVDGHRGIARDRRGVVRRRRVIDGGCDGRCDGRCIDRLGSGKIAHLFGRQATRQQADESKQEGIANSIHDPPLFLQLGEVIVPSFSDECHNEKRLYNTTTVMRPLATGRICVFHPCVLSFGNNQNNFQKQLCPTGTP